VNEVPFTTTLRDGVVLRGTLWTPAGRGPWPALLMRQPYGHRIASSVVYAHPAWYADQGYAVFVQDVRGCGDSDGAFRGFAQESADGSDSLAFVRNHAACNGRVGSYGFSYQGLTQLLGDDDDPGADALAPAMAGLDERLHWASEGGAHWWALGLAWGVQLAAGQCRRRGDDDGWRQLRTALQGPALLEQGLPLLQRHDPDNPVLAWLQRDPGDSRGWQRHDPPARRLARPQLLIEGWSDPYLQGGLDLWRRCRQAGGAPLLRIGPWSHLVWDRRLGASDAGGAATGRVDRWQLAFFDHHLRDRPWRVPPSPLLAFDRGTGRWHGRDGEQGSGGPWGLASRGLAAARSDEGRLVSSGRGGGRVVWVHDPWRPVPGRGGHLGLDPGPVDRGDLDGRADVVCFTGAAMRQPLTLWGEPRLSLEVAADGDGFDLCAALAVVRPGGRVEQISTGVLRCLGADCRRLQPRRLRLQPLLHTLAPGERLRLSLAAAAWPQVGVNPGVSGPVTLQLQLDGAELSLGPLGSSPEAGQTEPRLLP
jgi:putative CocE/NonD family hydrolase